MKTGLKVKVCFILSENDAVLLDDTYRNFVKVIFPIRPLRYYVIVILSQSQWLNMHEVNNDLMILLISTKQTESPERNRNKVAIITARS